MSKWEQTKRPEFVAEVTGNVVVRVSEYEAEKLARDEHGRSYVAPDGVKWRASVRVGNRETSYLCGSSESIRTHDLPTQRDAQIAGLREAARILAEEQLAVATTLAALEAE